MVTEAKEPLHDTVSCFCYNGAAVERGKVMAIARRSKKDKRMLSKDRIRKSVASSCAIETGEPSADIEARLNSGERRFPRLELAK